MPGTLAYISPERLAGKPAGPETDIWSTGVLLWEALAGRHPFGSGPFLEITKRIGRGAPALAGARPDLPKPLTQLVDAMLSYSIRRSARRPPNSPPASAARPSPGPSAAAPRLSVPRIPPVIPRLAPAIPAALLAGWATATFSFWPALLASPPGRARGAPLRGRPPPRARPSRSAMPILPLGNISLGLAALYTLRRSRLARRLLAPAARGAALPGGAPARRRRGDRAPAARRHPGRGAGAARSPDRCGRARRRGRRGARRSRAAGRRRRGARPRARGSVEPARCALRPLGRSVGVARACPRDDRARGGGRRGRRVPPARAPGAAPRSGRSCSAPRSSPIRTPPHCRLSPPPGSPRSSCLQSPPRPAR